MKSGGSLSIWFFIGISLLVNGALIFGAEFTNWCLHRSIRSCSTICTPTSGGAGCCWFSVCFFVSDFRRRASVRAAGNS